MMVCSAEVNMGPTPRGVCDSRAPAQNKDTNPASCIMLRLLYNNYTLICSMLRMTKSRMLL